MSTFLYKVVRNNVVTNEWTSDFAGPDYYEPSFGKKARWVAEDSNGNVPGEDVLTSDSSRRIIVDGGREIIEHHFLAQFTIVSEDVTAKLQAQHLLEKGLEAQSIGAMAVAQVYVINEQKFAAGTLSPTDFQAILADQTLAQIERLLYNGSLNTAKAMIQAYVSPYFSAQDKATVIAILDNSGLL